jgi:hypothetical protein
MPDTPDEIDPFQDKGEAGEEPLQTFRLKVGMTFAAGVLSIVATTAVLIVLNRDVERVGKPVGIDVALPVPSVMPQASATASTSATATATPSQSSRPSTVTGPPGTGPTHIPEATSTYVVVSLTSLSCTPSTVTPGQSTTCQVKLTVPAQSDLTIEISSSDSATLSVPATVTIATGSDSVTFNASASSEVTATATVTLTAILGTASKDKSITVNVEPPVL